MNYDFFELYDELESQKSAILAEAFRADELHQIADMVEAHDVDSEFGELVELARLTADVNPVSESAVEIKEKMQGVLFEIA